MFLPTPQTLNIIKLRKVTQLKIQTIYFCVWSSWKQHIRICEDNQEQCHTGDTSFNWNTPPAIPGLFKSIFHHGKYIFILCVDFHTSLLWIRDQNDTIRIPSILTLGLTPTSLVHLSSLVLITLRWKTFYKNMVFTSMMDCLVENRKPRICWYVCSVLRVNWSPILWIDLLNEACNNIMLLNLSVESIMKMNR